MTLESSDLLRVLLDLLVVSLAIFLGAKVVPGISVKDFGVALVTAIVLVMTNLLLIFGFKFFHLFNIQENLQKGSFNVLYDAILLWLSSKLVRDFQPRDLWSLLLLALFIGLLDQSVQLLFGENIPVLGL